jgi:pilus assembly protein TadC
MSPAVLGALLAGAAVAVLLRPPPRRELADLISPRTGEERVRPRLLSPQVACALAALAALGVLPLPVGAVLAVALLAVGPRVLLRLEPAAARRERERLRADLPLVLDLLGAVLAGGAPLLQAAEAVGHAVHGPAGRRLEAVAAALALGSSGPVAWAALAGASPDDDPLGPAARALARASDSGAPVAAVLARLADDARRESQAAGVEAARRAGVLAVAPLGLCFLPAFLLLGVVPVVVGLVGPVLGAGR